ncbi:hypothetical protein ACFSTE_10050 [Aquimarina hainanensis]|uniref:Uncharacterized protein n=1 Tax=Aquimarina hainanensis TaxID=1578017 RepID=A0ABW5N9C3_9FLAO|nr:hypothetical protein [Aquimarina sp. TRL1]QKX05661.1 hypothetical protein HN014_12315 [Aquimarina sp. TRL1]
MANKRELKKNINDALGEIIYHVEEWERNNPGKNTEAGEAIIDEAIDVFDSLIPKVNARKIENPSAHFKAVKGELETAAVSLIEKLNSL